MKPAVNKQWRNCLENFWKDYLIVYFYTFINPLSFLDPFLPMSVTNTGADNLCACLPLWTNTSKLECGPNQTLFGDNENSTQELR